MLVLASASPRREELLRNAGIQFTVRAANIPEVPLENEAPEVFAQRLAHEKAFAVAQERPGDFILGADTIVVVDDLILGKPSDQTSALRMLRLLSGRTHRVITGVCLIGLGNSVPSGQFPVPSFCDVRFETTTVVMEQVSDQEIAEYVATGEPMDKAGAYAIQGIASRWVSRIEGDYFNVVGLPVSLVYRMLQENQAV